MSNDRSQEHDGKSTDTAELSQQKLMDYGLAAEEPAWD